MSNEGTSAGNRQINANTGVTIGLVVTILAVSSAAIYKAGEVITDLGYVKRDISELRSNTAEMKRIIERIDRKQNGAVN